MCLSWKNGAHLARPGLCGACVCVFIGANLNVCFSCCVPGTTHWSSVSLEEEEADDEAAVQRRIRQRRAQMIQASQRKGLTGPVHAFRKSKPNHSMVEPEGVSVAMCKSGGAFSSGLGRNACYSGRTLTNESTQFLWTSRIRLCDGG